MNKKLVCMLLAVLMMVTASACSGTQNPAAPADADKPAETEAGGASADGDFKVAFLYDTPVTDGGWITSHDLGRQAVEEIDGVSTTYADNIQESDGWSYMNNFGKEGYDLVFACSFGYMQDCLAVSRENPDTIYMHCSGYEKSENMGNYYGRNYEGAYLAGMAAAGVSKTNLIGYVGSFPIAEVLRNVNAYALGAKEVNPDIKVQVVWINAWYNPTLASDAAETLIAAGCDVLFHYENSPAVVQTAAKHQVYAIGQHADNRKYSEDYCLTSSVWEWGVLYKHIAEQVRAGTWQPEEIWWGMSDGLVKIAELNPAVPDEVAKLIKAKEDGLKTGDIAANPFYGEVKDQKGEIRIPAGTDATMDELINMDYLVENVIDESTPK